MSDPKLEGQAAEEWRILERLVARDVEAQIEDHFEDRAKANAWRARNGFLPI